MSKESGIFFPVEIKSPDNLKKVQICTKTECNLKNESKKSIKIFYLDNSHPVYCSESLCFYSCLQVHSFYYQEYGNG